MTHNNIAKTLTSALLLSATCIAQAQHSWGIATLAATQDNMTYSEYRCQPEKGTNGIEYQRIYDESCNTRHEYYNPIRLQYGYRLADQRIYVYDYTNNTERIAFDFTIKAGDSFSTYNGMSWTVDEAKDTLVNMSYNEEGDCSIKRLLKVHSTDGKYHDEWLEDFGSFMNHFMILPMNEAQRSYTLWMEYEEGHYIAREISAYPFFTHSSMMPEHNTGYDAPYVNWSYKEGTLIADVVRWSDISREYFCFLLKGDDINLSYIWRLHPGYETCVVVLRKDCFRFEGMPSPSHSSTYSLKSSAAYDPFKGISTGIEKVHTINGNPAELNISDLQGRWLPTKHNGINVTKGRKTLVK